MSFLRPLSLALLAAAVLAATGFSVAVLSGAVDVTPAQAATTEPSATPAPVADSFRSIWNVVKAAYLDDVEQMPETGYAFRPTPETRTYASQLAHAAETMLVACTVTQGLPNPVPGFIPGQPGPTEASLYTKAEIQAFAERAMAACDQALAGLDDATLGQPVDFFGRPTARAFLLLLALGHTWHHDGSAVVYLREKGVVPTRSAPRAAADGSEG